MLLYVDDIVLVGLRLKDLQSLKNKLSIHLDVRSLGGLKLFLSVVFLRDLDGGFLSQNHYISDVLLRLDMKSCEAVSTPNNEDGMRDMTGPEDETATVEIYQEL